MKNQTKTSERVRAQSSNFQSYLWTHILDESTARGSCSCSSLRLVHFIMMKLTLKLKTELDRKLRERDTQRHKERGTERQREAERKTDGES